MSLTPVSSTGLVEQDQRANRGICFHNLQVTRTFNCTGARRTLQFVLYNLNPYGGTSTNRLEP